MMIYLVVIPAAIILIFNIFVYVVVVKKVVSTTKIRSNKVVSN